jgi:hypothetical protein
MRVVDITSAADDFPLAVPFTAVTAAPILAAAQRWLTT